MMHEGLQLFGIADLPAPTAREAAEADRAAREERDVPERVLMECAGRAAAMVLARLFPEGPVVAAIGPGNNGGDAIVVLRALQCWGREVAWVPVGDREPAAALRHGFELRRIDPAGAELAFARAGVLVDGILGTGATGAPRQPAAGIIEVMNRSGRPILALDLPSGVDSTTGEVPGTAISAAATVSFGWPKRGLLFEPARSRCGRLVAVEIGFPPPAPAGAALITPAWAAARLPRRAPDAHKNSEGRLLVLAGSRTMAGAAVIASEAAVRAGAGIVRVATAAPVVPVVQGAVPDVLTFDRADVGLLREAAGRSGALVAGPGLGLDDEARNALAQALEAMEGLPVLLDADATTILAADPDRLRSLAAGRAVLLTPHPGEMSRLTGESTEAILRAPVDAARTLAERSGCTVLLKGAPSVVAAPGMPVLIDTAGSSDAATAGMGDQLAGVAGAFLAAGLTPRDAAAVALHYGGTAMALLDAGRALSPRDVSYALAEAFRTPAPGVSSLELPFVTFDQPPRR